MDLSLIVLAAGQGTRMRSTFPKVSQLLANKPLIQYVVDTAKTLAPEATLFMVYGHQGEYLQTQLAHEKVHWIHQTKQLGTGHAVLQAVPHLNKNQRVVILYGDVPLITADTLQRLLMDTDENEIGILTAHLSDPYGYGRIKRNAENDVVAIVEEKDAEGDEERKITEINSGIYVVPAKCLIDWLPTLSSNNNQGEIYLTDIIAIAAQKQIGIKTVLVDDLIEITGVNTRQQLANLERAYQKQLADKLMQQGVTLIDPLRLDVRGNVTVGKDVIIDINVILEGQVVLGSNCLIGANVILKDVIIGDNVHVRPNSIVDGAEVAHDVTIGPFARIRPGTVLHTQTHVGNFVEIKKSELGVGTKINHLSYVGDSIIGKHVNFGAGAITCNYDGQNKQLTMVEDNAFIGSNTCLVAPVTVREGATIGAGSTITSEAPSHQLTIARARQQSVPNWTRPKKIIS